MVFVENLSSVGEGVVFGCMLAPGNLGKNDNIDI